MTLALTTPPRSRMWWLGACAVVIGLVLVLRSLSLGALALRLASDLRGHGWRGVVGFVMLFVCAEVAMVPGALLTMAAGYIYGPWWGVAVASPASLVAATVSFMLARTVLRARIRARFTGSRHFDAVRSAIADHSLKVVVLLRLSPLTPFNVANYAFGLSDVSLSHYVVASFVGLLPVSIFYAAVGSFAPSIVSAGAALSLTTRLVMLLVGVATGAAAVYVVVKSARDRLRQEPKASPQPGS